MDLPQRVEEYARWARAKMAAQIALLKGKEEAGHFKGYNSNGEIVVTAGGSTKAVHITGSSQPLDGQKVFIDGTNSADFGEKKDEQIIPFAPYESIEIERKSNQPGFLLAGSSSSSSSSSSSNNSFSGTDTPLPVFELEATVGFHMNTIGPKLGRQGISDIWAQLPYPFYDPFLQGVPSYGESGAATIPGSSTTEIMGKCYALSGVAVSVSAPDNTGSEAIAKASAGDVSVTESAGPGSSSYNTRSLEESFNVGEFAGISLKCDVERGILPFFPYTFLGDAWADAATVIQQLPLSTYYYNITDLTYGERYREIDLSDILPGQIASSRIVHNFANRELLADGSYDIFVYSIFCVRTARIGGEHIDGSRVYKHPLTHYIVHTRLSLKTGRIQSRTSISPNTGAVSVVTEKFRPYSLGNSHMFSLYVYAGNYGSSVNPYLNPALGSSASTSFPPENLEDFNPQAVFSNAFEGDWLYSFRDVNFKEVAAKQISLFEMYKFLQCSYKNGRWYYGLDSLMPLNSNFDTSSGGRFFEWIPPILSPYYQNADGHTSYTAVESLASNIISASNEIRFEDYFDGSVPSAPDDIDDWQEYGNTGHKGPATALTINANLASKSPFYNYITPILEQIANQYFINGRVLTLRFVTNPGFVAGQVVTVSESTVEGLDGNYTISSSGSDFIAAPAPPSIADITISPITATVTSVVTSY